MKAVISLALLSSAVADWEKCTGGEIAQCASCIFEYGAEALSQVIEASAEEGNASTVAGVLKRTGQLGLPCAEKACASANSQQFASQCGSEGCSSTVSGCWCTGLGLCVVCCGPGSWQCELDFQKPLCAPSLSQRFIDNVVKAKRVATALVNEATENIQDVKTVVAEAIQEVTNLSGRPLSMTPAASQPVTPAETVEEEMAKAQQVGTLLGQNEQPCVCGPGSGNPSTCCSACVGGTLHDRSNCVGHGENTGPYCGNDWHGVSCYGETYLCCTNDNDVPVCCKAGQRCHAPLVGKIWCVDEEETLVV